jgi:hypothetical protein
MNNFEKRDNITQIISQLIENLKIITDKKNDFSVLERDIILDFLKKAYLDLVQLSFSPTNIVDNSTKEKNEEVEKETVKREEAEREKVKIEPEESEEADREIIESEQEESKEVENEEIEVELEVEREIDAEVQIEHSEEEESATSSVAVTEEDLITFLPDENVEQASTELFDEAKDEAPEEPEEEVTVEEKESSKKEAAKSVPVQESLFGEAEVSEVKKEEKKKDVRSLNDLLLEQIEDKSLNNKFHEAKIEDLSKAISLNDKFLYIRELFKNQGTEFSKAIQTLNRCNTIDEAFAEIEKLKKFYFWDSTSEAYLSLCDLIRRKFS